MESTGASDPKPPVIPVIEHTKSERLTGGFLGGPAATTGRVTSFPGLPRPEEPYGARVLSPESTPRLDMNNRSYVPPRHNRSVLNRNTNGSGPTLPTHHHLEASDFDELMRDVEQPEVPAGNVPKTWIGRALVARQVRIDYLALPELEQRAASFWHFADTTLRRQSAAVNSDRGQHSTSAVTTSQWYREQTRATGSPPDLEPRGKVKIGTFKKMSARNYVGLKITGQNEDGQKALLLAREARNTYGYQEGQRLSERGERNKRKGLTFVNNESHHGHHAIHEVVHEGRAPAEEVARRKQRLADNRARLAAAQARRRAT